MRPYAPLADHDAVHHDLDGVAELLIELDGIVEAADLAVDAHAREALTAQIIEQLGELALAICDDRGQHEGAPALTGLEDLIGHLVGRLALDHAAALRAVRRADAREQQAQVVVDLGDRAHRGARVFARGLLVDGHRRRQAVDGIEVGLVHLTQELPGIAGQALNVAALALGVDRVEGEARLARAGQARDDDELVTRNLDVDVAQIVLARAADNDGRIGHGNPFGQPWIMRGSSLARIFPDMCSYTQPTRDAQTLFDTLATIQRRHFSTLHKCGDSPISKRTRFDARPLPWDSYHICKLTVKHAPRA